MFGIGNWNFSSGDWKYKFSMNGGFHGTSSYDIENGQGLICKIDGIDYDQKRNDERLPREREMEANAKLIAAAPVLARTLEELIGMINEDATPEIKKVFRKALNLLEKIK